MLQNKVQGSSFTYLLPSPPKLKVTTCGKLLILKTETL